MRRYTSKGVARGNSIVLKIIATVLCGSFFYPSISLAVDAEIALPDYGITYQSRGSIGEIDNSGAYTYSIPIITPPGRKGLQPDLSLSYNSQDRAHENLFGFGWSINIPYIERVNKTGTENLYSAGYFSSSLSGELEDISLSSGQYGTYGAKTETGDFLKYEYKSSDSSWLVTDKLGRTYKFGLTSASRQTDPNDSARISKWMLTEIRDLNDNYIEYEYTKETGQIYPYKIFYTGTGSTDGIFEVEFVTETRADVITSYTPDFLVTTSKRISEIKAKISSTWVRKYVLAYTTGINGNRSLLQSVTESGQDESSNVLSLPATTFTYHSMDDEDAWIDDGTNWQTTVDFVKGSLIGDINGDGLPDILKAFRQYPGPTDTIGAYINNGTDWDYDSNWNPPSGVLFHSRSEGGVDTFYGYNLIDVDGDWLSDLASNGGTYLNTGAGWSSVNSTWNLPLNFAHSSGRDTGVRFAEVNGDGLIDVVQGWNNRYNATFDDKVYINDGSGWTLDTSHWSVPVDFTDGAFIWDINGDWLDDVIQYFNEFEPAVFENNYIEAYINTGNDWVSITPWEPDARIAWQNVAATDSPIIHEAGRLIDANGDGLADMTREARTNTGEDWGTSSSLIDNPLSSWSASITPYPDRGIRLADFNGDGITDVVQSWDGAFGFDRDAKISDDGLSDRLTGMTTSQGAEIEVNYDSSAQLQSGGTYLNPSLPFPVQVVTSIVVDDGLGNTSTESYSYEGWRYYFDTYLHKKFAWFNKVTTTNGLGYVTKNFYHQGNTSDSSNGEYNDDDAKIGRVYRTEIYDNSSNKYAQSVYKWDKYDLGNGRDFVKLIQKIDFTYDGDGDHRDTAESYTYENTYGNLTQHITWGEVTGSGDGSYTDTGSDKFTTDYSYAVNTTDYVVGLVSEEETINQSSAKVKEVRRYYDSQSLGDVTDGNETKQEHWKVSSTYIDTEKTYNSYGLVTVDTDPRNFTTSYSYDANYLYPASITNAESHVTAFTYDYSAGKAKTMTDPNSRVFETVYDALDRPKEEKIPDITTPATLVTKTTVTYTDNTVPSRIQTTNHLDGSISSDVYTYIDGLGRKIQERKEAEDSQYSVKDFVYNDIGKIEKESLPYFSSGTSRTTATTNNYLYTSFTYDPLERVKTMVNSLGTTTNTYDQWETITTDPKSVAKDTHHDAYNRLIQVEEHNGGSTYTTSYEYNGLSKLTKITDAAGNLRNFTYDGLGRRLTAEDLHASADGSFGSWTYDYDTSGNMTQSVDPKSQTINYTYDDINRVLTENYTGTGGTEVTYVYDSGTNGTGHLYSAAVASGPTTVYTYNSRGSVASEAKTISGTTYTTSYLYDRQGNQTKITYPDNAEAEYEYNTAGLLEKVSRKESGGSSVYIISDYDYAPTEKVAYKDFTNAIDTYLTYDPNKLYRLANMMTIDPPEEGTEETASENLLTELLDIPQTPEPAAEETVKKEEKPTEEIASTGISKLLVDKPATERANIKGREIAKLNSIARTKRDAYDIEIVSMEAIEDGVQVFARAWKDGKQIGFGSDGTVDMERFRILNPPIMVPDKNGTYESKNEKGEVLEKYKEDPKEALLQVIEENLSVMKNIHGPEKIVAEKKWNTTSTFYPDADTESTSVDGSLFYNENTNWDTVHDATTGTHVHDDRSSGTVKTNKDAGYYYIERLVFLFNTASIPDNDTVTSANLIVKAGWADGQDNDGNDFIAVVASTPASNTALSTADFDQVGAINNPTEMHDSWQRKDLSSYSGSSMTFSFNATGIGNVSKTGVSKFGLREGHDIVDDPPANNTNNRIDVQLADQNGTTNDPKIVIEHSGGNSAPNAPTSHLTEGETNAVDVTDSSPEFSAIYTDPDAGDTAGAYQIQVIAEWGSFTSPLWDSTKTNFGTPVALNARIPDISYGGTALTMNAAKYYWRIRLWDVGNAEGAWSSGTDYFIVAGSGGGPLNRYVGCLTAQSGSTNPTGLKCGAPAFSAVFNDANTSAVAKKFRIQVNTQSDFAGTMLWDSGSGGTAMSDVAEDARTPNIIYAGDPLTFATNTYYWRIKFWDHANTEGAWSDVSNFGTYNSKVFQDNHYTYDANGNITKIVDSSDTDSARTVNYTYDDLNRLTAATATDVAAGQSTYSQTYTYSNIGNLTNKSDIGNYSYSSTGKANPHAATTINSVTHVYDDNGNLTDDDTWDYTWDYKNRLIEADDGTDTLTYAYDHTGQRVSTNDGTTTRVYPNKLYDKAGSATTKHIYANGELIATVDFDWTTTTVYHAHTDHLTGTGIITSSTPTEIQTLDYFPFGGVRLNDKAGSFDEKRQYAGSEFDGDTGLNYMNARYYKSTAGKFMSQDPIFWELGESELTSQYFLDPQQMNSYSYVANRPMVYIDPTGEFSVWKWYTPRFIQTRFAALWNQMKELKKETTKKIVQVSDVAGKVVGAIVYDTLFNDTPWLWETAVTLNTLRLAKMERTSSSYINLIEDLARQEARTNIDKWRKIIDRSEMWNKALENKFDKMQYIHKWKDWNNIVVHYHMNPDTGEVRDFEIKK